MDRSEPKENIQLADWNSGNSLGKLCDRHLCHEQGIPHFAAELWLTATHHNEIYVYFQKRADTKINFPGKFDSFVGGHLINHETPEACLVRETGEEISLDIDLNALQFFLKRRYMLQLKNYFDMEWIFHYKLNLNSYDWFESAFTDGEVAGLARFKLNEILNLFSGRTLMIYGQYFDGDNMSDISSTTDDFAAFVSDMDFWRRFSLL